MNPTITRDTCGTAKGYRQHYKKGEQRCRPCMDAFSTYCRDNKGTIENRMTTAEVATEIEWQLTLNQGQYHILRALGYTRNPATLERRLAKAGRHDINARLFGMDQAA